MLLQKTPHPSVRFASQRRHGDHKRRCHRVAVAAARDSRAATAADRSYPDHHAIPIDSPTMAAAGLAHAGNDEDTAQPSRGCLC